LLKLGRTAMRQIRRASAIGQMLLVETADDDDRRGSIVPRALAGASKKIFRRHRERLAIVYPPVDRSAGRASPGINTAAIRLSRSRLPSRVGRSVTRSSAARPRLIPTTDAFISPSGYSALGDLRRPQFEDQHARQRSKRQLDSVHAQGRAPMGVLLNQDGKVLVRR
jgi:hypothetical protein